MATSLALGSPCAPDLLTLQYAASTFPSRRSTESPTWLTAGLAEAQGEQANPPWEAKRARSSWDFAATNMQGGIWLQTLVPWCCNTS